ncbi:hypothetical protein [Tropicimonas aquimaris]|uniref:DoxX n=1 Tax=Tropicimonas aquimaris TaxID=914152 RepID=A0ABW3IT49_9RHOB
MRDLTRERLVLSSAGQNLLRILIASYFLAGAVGMIPGTDLTPMFIRVMPQPFAGAASGFLVFMLAYMVMIGVWLRGAALTLGILTFWSSYLRMLDLGVADELGTFWRDLALIAALMLTYVETDARALAKRTPVRKKIVPRKIVPRKADALDATVRPISGKRRPSSKRPESREPVSVEEMETIFREEFELARSN